jgi:hypothetical protein
MKPLSRARREENEKEAERLARFYDTVEDLFGSSPLYDSIEIVRPEELCARCGERNGHLPGCKELEVRRETK